MSVTLKEISNQTGIQLDFLRQCVKALKVELEPFQERGKNNAVLLDENSLGIMEKIKSLKDRDLSISAIVRTIKADLETDEKPTQTITKPSLDDRLLEAEKARYQAELGRLEAENQTIQNRYDGLKKNLLLLTDGRGYELEDIIKKREEESLLKGEKQALLNDLNSLSFWNIKRRKKLIARLLEIEKGG